MRILWRGQLEVGKLVIPVGLAATRQEKKIELRSLHKGRCRKPVGVRLYCEAHDRFLEASDVVRGYETSPGKYVALTDAELEQTRGVAGRQLKISSFVPAAALPPLAATASYYLVPDADEVAAGQYSLLQQTLAEQQVVALARMHWRSEWITAIRALPGSRALLLERLSAEDELVSPAPIDKQLDRHFARGRQERVLAGRLVAERTRQRPPRGALRNRETERLRELVERKLAGGQADLTSLLERSLRETEPKRPKLKDSSRRPRRAKAA